MERLRLVGALLLDFAAISGRMTCGVVRVMAFPQPYRRPMLR